MTVILFFHYYPTISYIGHGVIRILSTSASAVSSTLTSLPPKGQCAEFSQCKTNPIQHFLCLRCRLCLQLILFISPIFLNYFCALPYSCNMDPINKSRDIKEQNRICSWSGSLKCFVLILSWKYLLWIFWKSKTIPWDSCFAKKSSPCYKPWKSLRYKFWK